MYLSATTEHFLQLSLWVFLTFFPPGGPQPELQGGRPTRSSLEPHAHPPAPGGGGTGGLGSEDFRFAVPVMGHFCLEDSVALPVLVARALMGCRETLNNLKPTYHPAFAM